MKILILLLLAFNSYADVKIDITNNVNGRSYGAKFKTQLEADAWKAEQINDNSWGKKDRWKKKEIGDTCSAAERTSGDAETGFYNECFYPVEYVITETDITAIEDAKKAKKDAEAISMDTIKASIVDGSAKLSDIIEYIRIKEGL